MKWRGGHIGGLDIRIFTASVERESVLKYFFLSGDSGGVVGLLAAARNAVDRWAVTSTRDHF